jgi:hypothetical protein
MKDKTKYTISDDELDCVINYEIAHNRECNDEEILKILNTTAMCDGFIYNKENIELRISVVRLEVKDMDEKFKRYFNEKYPNYGK